MYDPKQVEEEILQFWKKSKIYEKAQRRNPKGTPFYFCDGPPYATGNIHPGTGWNKVIKDFVCRYARANGHRVRSQPGYDTHGLPIEVKVEQELGIKNKNEIETIGIEKFIQRCKDFATRYIAIMNGQFERLGVWMDFDDPYITYRDSYIASSWGTLKRAHDQGLLHEDVYVLPYCYRCETTVANYELEYGEETDPSIYVKFASKENENEYFVIWTTTPWTLVANMAIMVHPTLRYVKVKVAVGEGEEDWWVAKDRLDFLLGSLQVSGTVLEEVSGKKLEGRKYAHPFQDLVAQQAERRILLSDEYVTVEEGTGLVHTAPGTGPEDFIIGKRFGVEAFCPVDEHGNYTAAAGASFAGKNVKRMNPDIVALLKKNGHLLKEERIRHRYPHCWRCKTPLIFLTTKQWFITISKMKDRMLEEAEKVQWHPDFARTRFREFVETAPDWCISRQRYWGIPLPIWKCTQCHTVRVVGSPQELPRVKELHRPYLDAIELACPCKGKMQRIPDVLDVWFDSGNAVWAALSPADAQTFGERADVILEGQDQFRGWFYSLLGSGVVRYDACPYKRLVMHGFFVDEKGEKMSKSLGNFVPLEQIMEKYGADSFRLWSLSNTIWEELKFNWEELRKANGDLNILQNLFTFLARFYPPQKLSSHSSSRSNSRSAPSSSDSVPEPEDAWLRSRVQSVLAEFRKACDAYEINRAVKLLREFWVDDISRFYMKLAKERIAKDENADAALATLYDVNLLLLHLSGMVVPLISEHLYQTFFKKYEKDESLFLRPLPAVDEAQVLSDLEQQMAVVRVVASELLNARQEAKIKLRWPLRTLHVETKSHAIGEAVNRLNRILQRLCNVKSVEVTAAPPSGKKLVRKEFDGGALYISTEIDEELYEEGVLNEAKRRVQMLRKAAGLLEKDVITVYLSTEKELEGILEKQKTVLCTGVNAKELLFEAPKEAEEFEIDGRNVRIAIKKKEK